MPFNFFLEIAWSLPSCHYHLWIVTREVEDVCYGDLGVGKSRNSLWKCSQKLYKCEEIRVQRLPNFFQNRWINVITGFCEFVQFSSQKWPQECPIPKIAGNARQDFFVSGNSCESFNNNGVELMQIVKCNIQNLWYMKWNPVLGNEKHWLLDGKRGTIEVSLRCCQKQVKV